MTADDGYADASGHAHRNWALVVTHGNTTMRLAVVIVVAVISVPASAQSAVSVQLEGGADVMLADEIERPSEWGGHAAARIGLELLDPSPFSWATQALGCRSTGSSTPMSKRFSSDCALPYAWVTACSLVHSWT